jgi:hypothetical protein
MCTKRSELLSGTCATQRILRESILELTFEPKYIESSIFVQINAPGYWFLIWWINPFLPDPKVSDVLQELHSCQFAPRRNLLVTPPLVPHAQRLLLLDHHLK